MHDEYKTALRDLLARKGKPAQINRDAEYDFNEVSTYGWTDFEALSHCTASNPRWPNNGAGDCSWIVPEGATLIERSYSMFTDTFSDNSNEVGLNVYPAHCACGKYIDATLRYVASFAETMRELTGDARNGGITL